MSDVKDKEQAAMAGPFVSVIIPVFNRVEYLDEAIESVFAQTYDHWEIVLVDDGSTDGSFEKEQDWAARYPGRVRCVTHEGRVNRGISASRNLGVKSAQGAYIASLDSDDLWVPDKLEKQVRIARRYPEAGLIAGATRYWHPQEPRLTRVLLAGGPRDILVQPPQLFQEMYPLGDGTAPSMNTVLIRKDAIQGIGGWEDSFRTTYEDQAMMAKMYLSYPVYISSDLCDIYRQHAQSVMRTELIGVRYFRKRYLFLLWLQSWMQREQPGRIAEMKLVRERLRDPELWFARDAVRYNVWRAFLKAGKIVGKVTGWSGRS